MPFGKLVIDTDDTNNQFLTSILENGRYSIKFADDVFYIHLKDLSIKPDKTYRGIQMSKGIYLGHHVGNPCIMNIRGNDLSFFTKNSRDYASLIWSFAVKYIFTKVALENSLLHMKGTLLKKPNGKLILLFGRGGSGKTTMSRTLERYGFTILSNSHCFLKNNYVWGVSSWTKERQEGSCESEYQYKRARMVTCLMDGICHDYYIIDHNNQGELIYRALPQYLVYYYLRSFSCAICNYDLKEEVWDYFGNSFCDKIEFFLTEDMCLKEFTMNNSLKYLSADIFNDTLLEELVEIFMGDSL